MNHVRGMKFGLPLGLVVVVSALMMLNGNYTDVPVSSRWMIAIGGGVVSFIISYILFGLQDHKK